MKKVSQIPAYVAKGSLDFVLIPDFSVPEAYKASAQGCSYIIHVASPLATSPGNLEAQAVAGTRSILNAAEATPTIQRVVFTASTSCIRPFERLLKDRFANQALISGDDHQQVEALTADTEVPTQPQRSDDAPGFQRYIDSKIAANNSVKEYH